MTEKDNVLTETKILSTLQELLKWTKVSSYNNIKKMLESVLDSENKRIIYYLSDGKNGQDEIVEKGKVAAGSVSKYWHEWEKLGIGEQIPIKRGKRFKRSFNPDDFNIEIPKRVRSEKNGWSSRINSKR